MEEIFRTWVTLKKLMKAHGLKGNFTVTLSSEDFDFHLARAGKSTKAEIEEQGLEPDDIAWFRSSGIVFYRRPFSVDN